VSGLTFRIRSCHEGPGGGIAGTAVTGVLAGTGGVGVGVEDELMIRSASYFVYMVSIVPVARASAARDRLN